MALNNPLLRSLLRRGLAVDILRAYNGGGAGGGGALPAVDGWVLNRTFVDGGAAGLDIAAVLDYIDNSGRQITCLGFNKDGTKAYCGHNALTGPIGSFDLATPYDMSTATPLGSKQGGFILSFPYGHISTNDDGTEMYFANDGADAIAKIPLATAYQNATTDTVVNAITDTQIADPQIATAGDGSFWFDGVNGLYAGATFGVSATVQISIGTMDAFDTSTFSAGPAFDITTEMNGAVVPDLRGGFSVAPDGGSLYLWDGNIGQTNIHRWDMSTPYDCSTMENHTEQAYVSTYDLMFVLPDASRMYFIERSSGFALYEYLPA